MIDFCGKRKQSMCFITRKIWIRWWKLEEKRVMMGANLTFQLFHFNPLLKMLLPTTFLELEVWAQSTFPILFPLNTTIRVKPSKVVRTSNFSPKPLNKMRSLLLRQCFKYVQLYTKSNIRPTLLLTIFWFCSVHFQQFKLQLQSHFQQNFNNPKINPALPPFITPGEILKWNPEDLSCPNRKKLELLCLAPTTKFNTHNFRVTMENGKTLRKNFILF